MDNGWLCRALSVLADLEQRLDLAVPGLRIGRLAILRNKTGRVRIQRQAGMHARRGAQAQAVTGREREEVVMRGSAEDGNNFTNTHIILNRFISLVFNQQLDALLEAMRCGHVESCRSDIITFVDDSIK